MSFPQRLHLDGVLAVYLVQWPPHGLMRYVMSAKIAKNNERTVSSALSTEPSRSTNKDSRLIFKDDLPCLLVSGLYDDCDRRSLPFIQYLQ